MPPHEQSDLGALVSERHQLLGGRMSKCRLGFLQSLRQSDPQLQPMYAVGGWVRRSGGVRSE